MNENESLWAIYLGGERGVQRLTNHERANNLLIEDDRLTSAVPAVAYQSLTLNQTQQERIAEHQSILEEDAMARDERGKKGKLAESVNAKLLRLSSEGAGSYKIPKRRRSRSWSRGRRSRSRSKGRRNRSSSRSSSRSRSRGRRSRTRSRSRRRRTRSRSPDSSTAKIKRKFQEDRPNRRWTKKYDAPLPKTILDLCEEEECRICGIVITSMLVCEQHYDGAKHNRKIAVELEKFHQENPNEPMPKRIKKGGGPTPTITGQTESFLAELAGTMDLPLTPRQQEQRELWEPPLAPEVLALIKEDECGICDKLQLSSEVVAHGHYHGRKHEKRLLKMLADKGGKVPKKKGCIVAENTAWQQSMMSPLRCELCKVDFTGPACASLHYAGAKHQKRLNTANRMAEFNIEVEQEEVQPPPVEDRTFGIGTAFNQLSEADKERMEEVGKIEAMLAQAKSEATVAQGRQPAAALWGGLTEQDVELYTEGTMISPFYCTVCNIDCENQGSLDAHYRGKPHAKKVKAKENEDVPGLYCDICQISCASPDNMKMHLVSKKHQKNSRGNGVARDLGLFSCEICGVGCSDQCALDAHMSGQKHARVALKLARANTDFYAKN